nr:MAG TPA: hypothetical protein [Caudoviricetes sp.]
MQLNRFWNIVLFRGSIDDTHRSLSGLSGFVDHLIRLFTALGFLTGLLSLRSSNPDSDLIIVLLLILGGAVFYYSSYLFDFIVASVLSIIPFFERNELPRRIAATLLGLLYIMILVFSLPSITEFLSEIKPFG